MPNIAEESEEMHDSTEMTRH